MTRRPRKAKSARKPVRRSRKAAKPSASARHEPLDDFIAAGARALDLKIDKSWMPAVRGHLQVTLRHGALVATFARRNWSAFHRTDSSGYAFVGEQVLAFDRSNPQLAAALAGAFNLWRRFAEPRRSLQRAALEAIGRAPELSPDVAEIVERNLADC